MLRVGVCSRRSTTLVKYNVTGIADIVKGPKGHLGTPKVTLSFASDAAGIIGLQKAEATLEEMVEVTKPTPKPRVLPKKLRNLFNKKNFTIDDLNETLADAAGDNTTNAAGDAAEVRRRSRGEMHCCLTVSLLSPRLCRELWTCVAVAVD